MKRKRDRRKERSGEKKELDGTKEQINEQYK